MRTFLLAKNRYSKVMLEVDLARYGWESRLQNPVVPEPNDLDPKGHSMLAIFGNTADEPEIDPETQCLRRIGRNIKSLYAVQLDYDNGVRIDDWTREHQGLRYSLYTSYSYGIKDGDRFRVVIPLARELPCDLLQNSRVRKNLAFQWPGVDESCFHRGHWQALPIRAREGKYLWLQNPGKPWDFDLDGYTRWKEEDDREFERRAMEARLHPRTVDTQQLLFDMQSELAEIPVNQGMRFEQARHVLARYAHKGLGDELLGVPCPWSDRKWQQRWTNLVSWASTLQ